MENAIEFILESEGSDWDSNSSDSSTSTSSTDSSSDFENQNHQTIQGFEEVISAYSDLDFKKHFRLHRSTVQILIDRYKALERFQNNTKRGLPKVSPEKETFMFIWYMANTNTFRELANLFGVTKSTAWNVVRRFSKWLISIGHEYVKWPNANEAMRNAAIFEERCKIPGILGCIDGSHIRIKAPTENKESYFNRKKFYSICLQGVVDANKNFINIFAGEPGSLHDSRLLRRSDLYRNATENLNAMFPNNTFLLGDSAYASLDWLVPPFKDNGMLTNVESQFNVLHSSGRVVVEHAFGLLKTRFRRLLHFTEQTNINLVVNLVVCGCILHNLCSEANDELDANQNVEDNVQEPETTSELNCNNTRRQRLLDDLINTNIIRI